MFSDQGHGQAIFGAMGFWPWSLGSNVRICVPSTRRDNISGARSSQVRRLLPKALLAFGIGIIAVCMHIKGQGAEVGT